MIKPEHTDSALLHVLTGTARLDARHRDTGIYVCAEGLRLEMPVWSERGRAVDWRSAGDIGVDRHTYIERK